MCERKFASTVAEQYINRTLGKRNYVRFPVAVEVTSYALIGRFDQSRGRLHKSIPRERPITIPQQHSSLRRKVELAVAVEISYDNGREVWGGLIKAI